MPRNPKVIKPPFTARKHRCIFCEALGSRTVEIEVGATCPVCDHYCTCE